MQLEFEPWLLLITLSAAAGLTLGALAAPTLKAWPLAARCLPSSIFRVMAARRGARRALLVPAELLALAPRRRPTRRRARRALRRLRRRLLAMLAGVARPAAVGSAAPAWLVKWIGRVGAAVAVWLALGALLLVILDSAAGASSPPGPRPRAANAATAAAGAAARYATDARRAAAPRRRARLGHDAVLANRAPPAARRVPTLADRGRARAAPFFTALADRGRGSPTASARASTCAPPDWRRPGAAFARADRPKPAAVAPSLERQARVEEKSDPLRLHNADLPKPRRGSRRATASSGALPEPPPPSLSAKHAARAAARCGAAAPTSRRPRPRRRPRRYFTGAGGQLGVGARRRRPRRRRRRRGRSGGGGAVRSPATRRRGAAIRASAAVKEEARRGGGTSSVRSHGTSSNGAKWLQPARATSARAIFPALAERRSCCSRRNNFYVGRDAAPSRRVVLHREASRVALWRQMPNASSTSQSPASLHGQQSAKQ